MQTKDTIKIERKKIMFFNHINVILLEYLPCNYVYMPLLHVNSVFTGGGSQVFIAGYS